MTPALRNLLVGDLPRMARFRIDAGMRICMQKKVVSL